MKIVLISFSLLIGAMMINGWQSAAGNQSKTDSNASRKPFYRNLPSLPGGIFAPSQRSTHTTRGTIDRRNRQ